MLASCPPTLLLNTDDATERKSIVDVVMLSIDEIQLLLIANEVK